MQRIHQTYTEYDWKEQKTQSIGRNKSLSKTSVHISINQSFCAVAATAKIETTVSRIFSRELVFRKMFTTPEKLKRQLCVKIKYN